MLIRKRKKILAQSTLEYAVLIMLVTIALLATQIYIKRGIQGRLKSSADEIGDQFSPGAANISTTTNSSSTSREVSNSAGSQSVLGAGGEVTNRVVITNIEGYNSTNEYWGKCGDGVCAGAPVETHENCPMDC
jgi:Flp pilus assembly pilin Flp